MSAAKRCRLPIVLYSDQCGFVASRREADQCVEGTTLEQLSWGRVNHTVRFVVSTPNIISGLLSISL